MNGSQLDLLTQYIDARLDAAFEKDKTKHKLAHEYADLIKRKLYRSIGEKLHKENE